MPTFHVKTILAVLLAGTSSIAFAQTSAQISGRVTDQSGAVVAGAKVKLVNTDTGATREAPANTDGYYRFPLLPPGTYSVGAQTTGFKTETRYGIQLEEQQSVRIDLALQVGDLTQSVTITAEAPLLQNENGSVGTTVPERAVMDLPLANAVSGRDPVELLQALPGATNRGIAGTQSINGGQQGMNDVQVNGVSKVDEYAGNSSGAGGMTSLDTVREVKLLTNTYSAEFGRSGGGTVLIVTQTGTNKFHGTVYEYFRNVHFAAKNFFAVATPPLHSNQFGATLGGPIRRNRTFFFSSIEAWYYRTASVSLLSVPTVEQRAGDFSQTFTAANKLIPIYDPTTTRNDPTRPNFSLRDPFPGNAIPSSRFDTVGAKIAAYYGLPNYPGIRYTNGNNFIVNDSSGRQYIQNSQQATHQFSSNNTMSARAFTQQLDQKQPVVFNNMFNPGANNQHAPNRAGSLTDTAVLSPALVNEARLAINWIASDFNPMFPADSAKDLGLKGLPTPSIAAPVVAVSGLSSLGQNSITVQHQLQYQAGDTLSYSHGRHQIKTGVDFRRFHMNKVSLGGETGNLSFSSAFTNMPGVANTGVGLADLLLGYTNNASVSVAPGYGYRSFYVAGFIQEDWRVRPDLVLNIGMRYDYEAPTTEVAHRMANFSTTLIEPITKLPGALVVTDPIVNPDRNNWGPRFGFAWAPEALHETVVRGGYGIQYAPVTRQNSWGSQGFTATTTFSSLNGVTPAFMLSQGFPYYTMPPASPNISALLGQSASWIDTGNRTPYLQLWSFGVQRQMPGRLLLDLAYVGNKATRLPFGSSINLNQLHSQDLKPSILNSVANPYAGKIPGTLGASSWTVAQSMRMFPQYQSVSQIGETIGNSNYHSLQFKAEKRLSGGLYFINSYTWSKMLSDTSGANVGSIGLGDTAIQDMWNLSGEKGPTMLDIHQRFVSMMTYDVPIGKGRRWMKQSGWSNQVFGGWQVNWVFTTQSGQPLTIVNPNFTYAGGGSRPNRVCNGALSGWTFAKAFDTSCFVDQPYYAFGNSGVGIINGPGLLNLDTSMFKKFPIAERYSLQIRAEAFNVMNHPNFGNPGLTLDSGSFGAISSARGSNLDPTGGPRMLQFALRLLF